MSVQTGKKYAICIFCNRRWNIANNQSAFGYGCPECEEKRKKKKGAAHSNATDPNEYLYNLSLPVSHRFVKECAV